MRAHRDLPRLAPSRGRREGVAPPESPANRRYLLEIDAAAWPGLEEMAQIQSRRRQEPQRIPRPWRDPHRWHAPSDRPP